VSLAAAAPSGFYGLVAHPNGAVVPVDEPAVAAARADHLASHGIAYAGHAAAAYGVAPAAAYAAVPAAVGHPAAVYNGPLHYPTLVGHPNGAVVPADEPAVAAARADHLASHGVAYAAHGGAAYAPAALVAHPNGAVVPADEPAVVAARADHLAAHGVAYAAYAPAGYAHAAYAGGYYGGLVGHPNGAVVPVDEPAVQAARAEHFAAKAAIGH
jgi:hypothetical protein